MPHVNPSRKVGRLWGEAVGCLAAQAPPCRGERVDFGGWHAVRLTNSIVEAIVVPDIGGRIMVYDLGPYRYL